MKMFRLLAPAIGLFAFSLPSMTVPAAAQPAAPQETQFSRVEIAMAQDIIEEVFMALEAHKDNLNPQEKAITAELEAFADQIDTLSQQQNQMDLSKMTMEQINEEMQKKMEAISTSVQASANKLAPLFIKLQTKYPAAQCNEKAVSAVLANELASGLFEVMMQEMMGGMLSF